MTTQKSPPSPPLVTFNRLIPSARPPQRADRSGAGTLPTRAFRYCEAVTTATGLGWYVFPPVGLTFLWDGTQVFWSWDGGEEHGMLPLEVAQFPGFADTFDAAVPEKIRGFSPPFVAALKEPGIVQIWSGLIARTAPGWSLLVRPPANLPRAPGYEVYEGIIETDRWFGPLFTNIRLTKTDVPIRLGPDFPFATAVPVPRMLYGEDLQNTGRVVADIATMTEEDWADYRVTVVEPCTDPERARGRYATESRKRRKGGCPYAAAAAAGAAT
jgi:hypothetical protein